MNREQDGELAARRWPALPRMRACTEQLADRDAKAQAGPRRSLFQTCANPDCCSGWLHLWRSRQAPVFEGGWSCSSACTAARVASAVRRELDGRVRCRGDSPPSHSAWSGDARTGLDYLGPVAPGARCAAGGRSRTSGPLAGAPAGSERAVGHAERWGCSGAAR